MVKDIKKIESLTNLLALPGVVEIVKLRSKLGICALHGGGLERATEAVAREVAQRTNTSYYAVIQPEGSRHHLPSVLFNPKESNQLEIFLKHSKTIISIHGYGKDDDFWAVLLGGSNRILARHIAGHLRSVVPDEYRVVDNLDEIPKFLRGLHPSNPVNRVVNGGVQIEIPPGLRWNREYNFWSDADGTPRTEQLNLLIDGLVTAVANLPKIQTFD